MRFSLKLLPVALIIAAASCVVLCTTDLRHDAHLFSNQPLETNFHRLPRGVTPTRYLVRLNLSTAFEAHRPGSYTGETTIDVVFRAPRRRSPVEKGATALFDKYFSKCIGRELNQECQFQGRPNEIVMHADESVNIDTVEVLDQRGKPMKIAKTGRDVKNQMIVIQMARDLPRDGREGQIKFHFTAPIRNDDHGLYFSSDTSNGADHQHVAAKFQPSFARLALPCFDEPSFRAVFEVQLLHSSSKRAYANSPLVVGTPSETTSQHLVTSIFEPTPPMPIHMVAFVVGDFDDQPLSAEVRPGLTLRFLSVPGAASKGAYALEVARRALVWFEDFIDNKFPLKKLDIVAISETDTDNTESWGLVFVRDFLANQDEETTEFSRIATAVNVAHVVVHQWFANLVSAAWWDDLWITEAVAAQMAFEFVQAEYAHYESEYFVRIETLSNVLAADGSGRMHSLSPPEDELSTSGQIYQIFDELTFMKSGATARMLQDRLGREHFQAALRLLVAKHAYTSITYDDFLECLKHTQPPQGRRLGLEYRLLQSFAKLRGLPVLNVALSGYMDQDEGHLLVYLEAFDKARPEVDPSVVYDLAYHDEHDDESLWQMPLEVLLSDGHDRNEVIPVEFGVMSVAMAELPKWFNHEEHFLKLQPKPNFSTYYRVRYSDSLLHQLRSSIGEKLLSPMDRLHVLDDASALVKSNLIRNDTYRELFDVYAQEDNLPVVLEMLAAAQTLGELQVSDPEPSPSLGAFMKIYEKYGFRVSGKESLAEQRARSMVLKWLVGQNVQQVVAEALGVFDAGNVAVFLREPVYLAVAMAGTEVELNQLFKHMSETSSYEERLRLANALAVSVDVEALAKLAAYLNEQSGFKLSVLETIVQAQPLLSIDHGKVVLAPHGRS